MNLIINISRYDFFSPPLCPVKVGQLVIGVVCAEWNGGGGEGSMSVCLCNWVK